MTYGTTFDDGTHICERFNSLYVQKKQNHGQNWTRGSYSAYDHFNTFRREQDLIYPHVPLIDCMERSLPARGATRREYALRKLEENYSPKERQDFTEFTKSIKRKYKDERCQSPRFVLGDQSLTVDGYAAAESTQHRKKRCVHDGRSSNDTGSYRVLQALGSDVIAHWLTPMDMYNVKCAFRNDWKWARVWRGCRVKSPEASAKVRVCLELGYDVQDIHAAWGTRSLMDGVYRYLTDTECERLALEYNDIRILRKLT